MIPVILPYAAFEVAPPDRGIFWRYFLACSAMPLFISAVISMSLKEYLSFLTQVSTGLLLAAGFQNTSAAYLAIFSSTLFILTVYAIINLAEIWPVTDDLYFLASAVIKVSSRAIATIAAFSLYRVLLPPRSSIDDAVLQLLFQISNVGCDRVSDSEAFAIATSPRTLETAGGDEEQPQV